MYEHLTQRNISTTIYLQMLEEWGYTEEMNTPDIPSKHKDRVYSLLFDVSEIKNEDFRAATFCRVLDEYNGEKVPKGSWLEVVCIESWHGGAELKAEVTHISTSDILRVENGELIIGELVPWAFTDVGMAYVEERIESGDSLWYILQVILRKVVNRALAIPHLSTTSEAFGGDDVEGFKKFVQDELKIDPDYVMCSLGLE